MNTIHKVGKLTDIEAQGAREYRVTLYDSSILDRDGESIDVSTARAQEPLTLQIDHDHSVLRTVGLVRGIRAAGPRLRGVLSFAPEGVSEVADQVARQVATGVTSTVSVGFIGRPERAEAGHRLWRDIEVLELSFVSVPASPAARVDRGALKSWLASDGVKCGDDIAVELTDDPLAPAVELGGEDIAVEMPDADVRSILARLQRSNPARLAGLLDETTYDVDARALARAMKEVVPAVLRDIARDAVERELKRLRGRVD